MQENWKDLLDDHHESLPILCVTTDLDNEVLDDRLWKKVRQMYEEVNEDNRCESRVMVSVINAILTQKRSYFCLTRDRTRCLVQTDSNHSGMKAFDNEAWTRVLSFLIKKMKIMSGERKGIGQQPSIYALKDQDLFELVGGVDPSQLDECEDFVLRRGKFSPQTNKEEGTGKSEMEKKYGKEQKKKERKEMGKPIEKRAPSGALDRTAAAFSWNDLPEEQPPVPDWLSAGFPKDRG
jgi:hypothetical protein